MCLEVIGWGEEDIESYVYTVLLFAVGPTASKARVRSIVLGAALGGSIGVPAGFLQEKIVTMLPPEQQEARQIRTEKMEKLLRGEQPGKN